MSNPEHIIKFTQPASDFIKAYDFEVYDIVGTMEFFTRNRRFLYYIIGFYLAGIICGQKFMKNRAPFKLTYPLFLWNLGLALFSILATFRGFPELAYLLLKPDGIYNSVCSGTVHNYATSFWALTFFLSKFIELGDTAFIVLRKQKLIVLHWFHHVATLTICWIGYELYDAAGRLYVINTFVHSCMYTYYAFKALKIKIPKGISKAITTLQIAQMLFFLFLNFSSVYFMAQGRPCSRNVKLLYLGGLIILIFTGLFIKFFKEVYFKGSRRKLD